VAKYVERWLSRGMDGKVEGWVSKKRNGLLSRGMGN
jgi:hypothetical protein